MSTLSLSVVAGIIEPEKPVVNKTFDSEKEAKIKELAGLSYAEAFDKLKAPHFRVNKDLRYKAIYTAFKHRKSKAIVLTLNYLTYPLIEKVKGRLVNRSRDFTVAKGIFEVFPVEATPRLLSVYENSGVVTKSNIILASGKIAGGSPVKDLLVRALDDKTFYEEDNPDLWGVSLRICDLAYNQLVFRYKISDLARVISTAYDIKDRDYHIDILKKRFLQ